MMKKEPTAKPSATANTEQAIDANWWRFAPSAGKAESLIKDGEAHAKADVPLDSSTTASLEVFEVKTKVAQQTMAQGRSSLTAKEEAEVSRASALVPRIEHLANQNVENEKELEHLASRRLAGS